MTLTCGDCNYEFGIQGSGRCPNCGGLPWKPGTERQQRGWFMDLRPGHYLLIIFVTLCLASTGYLVVFMISKISDGGICQ